jgi:hypothetical protein
MIAAFRERAGGLEHMTGTKCGGQIRLISFIDEAIGVRETLAHLGQPTSLPSMASTRGPSLWESRWLKGRVRPAGPAGVGLRIRSAHRLLARRGSNLARRGTLVPWVTETASAAAAATHGTACVVILARFSGFISTQFPRDEC